MPVSPKPLRNGVLGLAVGLVFGLGVAFLAEYLDKTIKSVEEAQQLYGAPVLGRIPSEQFDRGTERRLTIVVDSGSRAAEAYRGLRNSIDYVNFKKDIKTLLVTSAAPAEGKSTVAANLAASLAMAGARVVFVNCDFRRPTTDQFFSVSNAIGLSDVLSGRVSLKSALQQTDDARVTILTSGPLPPNPSELLGSEEMIALVDALKKEHDWVIVDSPPLLAVADAAAMARWTDGVLVITRAGVSTHPAGEHAKETLDQVGARVLGVVVWGLDELRGGRGGYGGYYGSYYYAHQAGPARGGSGGAADADARGTGSRVGTRIARWIHRLGGFWSGVLAFVVVLLAVVAVLAVLDWMLGWGFSAQVRSLLR